MTTHNTKLDGAGFSNRARLTCHTCGQTCFKQPYMTQQYWTKKVNEFVAAHPGEEAILYQTQLHDHLHKDIKFWKGQLLLFPNSKLAESNLEDLRNLLTE